MMKNGIILMTVVLTAPEGQILLKVVNVLFCQR